MTRTELRLPLRARLGAAMATGLLLATVVWGSPNASAAEPKCAGKVATIVGTRGPDRLTGTSGADVILGLGGRDVIDGRRGDDVICGGKGRDRLVGGPGRDRLLGGDAGDRLIGGGGEDEVDGGRGPDWLSFPNAEHGVDVDMVAGTAVVDGVVDHFVDVARFRGTPAPDTFQGSGGISPTTFLGRGGDDRLTGASKSVDARGREDHLLGGSGNDFISGGARPDFIEGGPGDDVLYGDSEDLNDGLGVDTLLGGPGDDRLLGGRSRDFLFGGAGRDSVDGGPAEFDMVGFSGARRGVHVDLETGVARTGAGDEPVIAVEQIAGSRHDDVLLGDDLPNLILAGRGRDRAEGRGGSESLLGDDTFTVLELRRDFFGKGLVQMLVLDGPDDADVLEGGDGSDSLYDSTRRNPSGSKTGEVIGGDGADSVHVGGDEAIELGPGKDLIVIAFVADGERIDGDGSDSLTIRDPHNLTVDLDAGLVSAASSSGRPPKVLEVAAFQRVATGTGNDRIYGTHLPDLLSGGPGNDRIYGRRGDDRLFGRLGRDHLFGQGDHDQCDGGLGADELMGCEPSG